MAPYGDGMYIQGVVEEKRPLYIEFIRKVLQCYQMNKNLFTAYAPDVQFEGIKSSVSRFFPSRLVVPITEDIPLTSPFAEDSSKLNNIISGLPSVHHNRGKRQRREAEQQSVQMVMYENYDTNYMNGNGVLGPADERHGQHERNAAHAIDAIHAVHAADAVHADDGPRADDAAEPAAERALRDSDAAAGPAEPRAACWAGSCRWCSPWTAC